MRTKSADVARDLVDLSEINRPLFAVLGYADLFARMALGVDLMVTSIKRDDDTVHSVWRGADIRIYHDGRDVTGRELTMDEAEDLRAEINRTFEYGLKGNGEPSVVAHIVVDKKKPENTHLHLQVTSIPMWGTITIPFMYTRDFQKEH